VDRKPYGVHPGLMLPPLTRDLQIDYTAFSFADPGQVRFRYKLEGYDSEWSAAGSLRQAQYTNLAPRRYRFRVIAANNDGVWNEAGASLEFGIQPTFYQTNWFKWSCVAAFGLLLWGVYQLRVRHVAAQISLRFEARLAERTRISRELHDTLLQNITGFALQLGGLSKTVTGSGVREGPAARSPPSSGGVAPRSPRVGLGPALASLGGARLSGSDANCRAAAHGRERSSLPHCRFGIRSRSTGEIAGESTEDCSGSDS